MNVLVPNLWSDVTVGEFQQLADLPQDAKSNKRLADVISILCNINPFDLDKDSIADISANLNFMNTEISKDRYSSFTHDGVEYEWIKSLDEITLGEMISIEQTIEQQELNIAESFDLVMAVLLVEKGGKFDATKIIERREKYSEFPIDKVHGMLLFFLSGGRLCLEPTKMFSVMGKQKKIERTGLMKRDRLTKRLTKKLLATTLNGLLWLTGWLRMILQSMN